MINKHETSPCPDEETLCRWASHEPEKMDPALFQHLIHCDSCQEKWHIELEYGLYKTFASGYVPTEEDLKQVGVFVTEKLKEENCWNQLTTILSQYCPPKRYYALESGVDRVRHAIFPAMVASGDNVNERLYSVDKGELKIVFIAKCLEDDLHYWKAELTIPPKTSHETILSLFITNSKGRSIASGKFILLDQELPIEDGIAELTFAEFLKNMRKHTVKLVFPDEMERKGTLRFFEKDIEVIKLTVF